MILKGRQTEKEREGEKEKKEIIKAIKETSSSPDRSRSHTFLQNLLFAK